MGLVKSFEELDECCMGRFVLYQSESRTRQRTQSQEEESQSEQEISHGAAALHVYQHDAKEESRIDNHRHIEGKSQ